MAEPQTTEADGALCHSLRTLDIGDAHVVILRDGVNEIDIPCKDRGRLERHSHFFRALFEFRDREASIQDNVIFIEVPPDVVSKHLAWVVFRINNNDGDDVTVKDIAEACGILRASVYFQCQLTEVLATESLTKALSPINCLAVFKLALDLGCQKLEQISSNFFSKVYGNSSCQDVISMSLHAFERFVDEEVRDNALAFCLIQGWVELNETHEDAFERLVNDLVTIEILDQNLLLEPSLISGKSSICSAKCHFMKKIDLYRDLSDVKKVQHWSVQRRKKWPRFPVICSYWTGSGFVGGWLGGRWRRFTKAPRSLLAKMSGMKVCLVQRDKLYFVGGEYGLLWVYNLALNTWKAVCQGELECRVNPAVAAAVSSSGEWSVYVFGGYRDKSGLLDSAAKFDVTTGRWTQLMPLPYPCAGAKAVTTDDGTAIYLFGGMCICKEKSANVLRYEIATDDYSEMPSIPVPISRFGTASHRDVIYLVGGCDPSTYEELDTVQSFNVSSNEWHELPPLSTPRIGCCCICVDDEASQGQQSSTLWVFGGSVPSGLYSLASCERYSLWHKKWIPSDRTLPRWLVTTGSMFAFTAEVPVRLLEDKKWR